MEGTTFSPRSPAEVVAAANALLAGVDEVLWAARTPDEVVDAVAACEAIRAHLAAIEAAALVEVEGRKIARQHLAWSSTGDWFTHLAGTHHGTGQTRGAAREAPRHRPLRNPGRVARRAGLPRAGRDHL